MSDSKANTTELVEIPAGNAMEVYTQTNGLDPYLERIRKEIDSFVPDVSTDSGRKEIASMAYKVARSKTSLDGVGKQLVAELKDKPRKIDAERKRMRDLLDEWRDEVRKPLTEFEEAEHQRVTGHESRIAEISEAAEIPDDVMISSGDIQARIDSLESTVIDESFEEFEAPAGRAKQAAINALKAALTDAKEREQREAEEERKRQEAEEKARKEREEQIRKEAAEAERKAAEERAKAERERIEKERQAERDAAEEKERERLAEIERQKREAAEAESERLRKIQAEKDEADQRARDVEHRRKINAAARDALISAGVPEEHATSAVRAIAAGDVPAVSIQY